MQLIRGQCSLTKNLKASVITIGNFDGMHLGHQQLLKLLKEEGESLNIPSTVITFKPSPKNFFNKMLPVSQLMFLREKWQALAKYEIDYLVCLRFQEQLASLSAEDFVEKILIAQLGMKAIVLGDDFRFGAKRKGDINFLHQLGEQLGFKVIVQSSFLIADERVSSSRIRMALEQGDLANANFLLGRNYFLSGRVIHGDKRGRSFGFPTANINLHANSVPLRGIFAVTVEGLGKDPLPAVASLGTRPMFQGADPYYLEVYILDFDKDIYDRYLKINFLQKIRDEAKFDGVEALIAQIHLDVKQASEFFNQQDSASSGDVFWD